MTDDFFGDSLGNDPFDSIVRQFFGNRVQREGRSKTTRSKDYEEESDIVFIESDDKIFFYIEIPGYSEKDITVEVNNKVLEINAKKSNAEGIQDYLVKKFKSGVSISKNIPSSISTKKFTKTYKNGILEVAFNKK
ncbi:MAG: Hsp20/alpha crystallin family protein [Nanoarchaeota archaeon]